MPVRHMTLHLIDKKPDGTPAILHIRDTELPESQTTENLMRDLNESYNAKVASRGAFSMLSLAHSHLAGGWPSTWPVQKTSLHSVVRRWSTLHP